MLLGVCPASFGVPICGVVLDCRYTPETTGQHSQWCQFFNWGCGCVECDLAHRRSVAVFCMLYMIRCNPMHLFMVLFICQCGLHTALWFHISTLVCLLAAELRSTAGLLFSCQYLCGTILVTPYSIGVGLAGFKSRANAVLL